MPFESRRRSDCRSFAARTAWRRSPEQIAWRPSPAIAWGSSASASTDNGGYASAGRDALDYPGEVLRDELAELGLSARDFAMAPDIPVNRVTQIMRQQRGVTADTALRLGRYFGTSPEFWMDLQSDDELRRARREIGPAIAHAVTPRAA